MELIKYLTRIEKTDVVSVGQYAEGLSTLLDEGIPIPLSFVLTKEALPFFLDFSGVKSQIAKLMTSGAINFRRLEKAIIDSAMPPIMEKSIQEAYKRISGFIESYAIVRPYLYTANGSLPINQNKQRIILGASALSDVIRRVFAETLIESSDILKKVTEGYINLGILVQKLPLEEVSGKVTTSDIVTKKDEHLWIEAVYGMWEITEKEGIVPDQYIYSKTDSKTIDKHVSKQQSMIIRQLYKNRASLEKIPVSSIWQTMPKLNDKYIDNLAKIGMLIENFYQVPCEIDWIYESGKLWITDIDPLEKQELRNEQNLATENIKLEIKGIERNRPIPVKPKFWAKTIKTKDVVSRGIGNCEGYVEAIAIKEQDYFSKKVTTNEKVALIVADASDIEDNVLSSLSGIIIDRGKKNDSIIPRTQMLGIPLVFDTAIATRAIRDGEKIWIDAVKGIIYKIRLPKIKPKKTFQSNNSIAFNLDKALELTRTATKVLIEYKITNITDVLQSDNTSEYSDGMVFTARSSFDGKITELINAFYQQGKPALANIESNTWLESMAKEIYTVRNKNSLKGIWMILPSYSNISEMREAKHLLLDIGLRRSSTFKLFGSIKRPSQLFSKEDFFDIGLDGVFLDLPAIQHSLSGRIMNKVTSETLKPVSDFCKATGNKQIETYVNIGELKLTKTGVETLIKSGVYAFVTNDHSYFAKLKNIIGAVEHALITRHSL